jgi:LacI family transcriptional regulator, galactose operon repressor
MVNLKDVAKESGVSIKTVSNVVNDFKYISRSTKEKVLQAIKKLGYVPNKSARDLALGINGGISVKFHSGLNFACILRSEITKSYDSYFSNIFQGIEDEIKKQGHFLFFTESYEELEKNPVLMNGLLNSDNLDGIISFIGPDKESIFKHLKRVAPIISIGKVDGIGSVTIDKEQGIKLALKHLVDLGHRKIAFIGGSKNNNGYYDARYTTFLSEVIRLNLISGASWQIGDDFGYDEGYKSTKILLKNKELPTAIICISDITAIGVVHALYDEHIAIPDDMSIVGFDNVPESQVIYPPLTTIDVNKRAIGAAGVCSLLELIKNPKMEVSTKILPAKLVERKSTAHPKTYN